MEKQKYLKVLFVSSGNLNGIGVIVKSQGLSLSKEGVVVDHFGIKGKGITGYLSNIIKLRNHLRKHNPDIVHAHYSLSAFVASIAGAKPLVVSLMGSDVKAPGFYKSLIRLFRIIFRWKLLIVKSEDMLKSIKMKDISIIPNGVNIEIFHPIDNSDLKENLGFSDSKFNILFLANPSRVSKNFNLAKNAVNKLPQDSFIMQVVHNVKHSQTPNIINAADIVLLTSLWEGSPNIIKEAMSCNIPIVSTKVGDIAWLFGDEPGYYIADFDPNDVAEKILIASEFSKKYKQTKGRDRIIKLKLDSASVANQLISNYITILNNEK